jgi:WS/DGAT/MGAT family acyltransferase
MGYSHWERLSAIDAAFLAVEDENAHMHIGSVGLFDAKSLTRDDGGLEFDRILEFVDAKLYKAPRFRQKVALVPGFDQPVWVDDAKFNLAYHVRHACLPAPGDIRTLKRLAGRILSQQLDRGKPLWEQWFVEGVEGGRFAVITKLHHCMADGISGSSILTALMEFDPLTEAEPAPVWIPRPTPSARQMILEEMRYRAGLPFSALSGGSRPRMEWGDLGSLRETIRQGIAELPRSLSGMSSTFLNAEIGPHRRFDWATFDLEDAKSVARAAGGKLNDVVLAVVAGALRHFLARRGESVVDLSFRVMVPVSLRKPEEGGKLGNRVSALMVELPLDEADSWRRLLRVVETTRELKHSGWSERGELLEQLMELVPQRWSSGLTQRLVQSPLANLVVTNVPGPAKPIYLLGARQLESYPVVPLAPNQGLGIALYSYDGTLYWGLNSDWDALPDLHDLAEEIGVQFEALQKATPRG